MKTTLLVLLVLSSALGLQARNQPAASGFSGELPLHHAAAKIHANGDVVTIGTSRIMVSMRLGSPNVVLADGSWLYNGYSAQLSPSGPNPRGTLVVRFTNSQVTSLTLADNDTVVALRQSPQRSSANRLLAVR